MSRGLEMCIRDRSIVGDQFGLATLHYLLYFELRDTLLSTA